MRRAARYALRLGYRIDSLDPNEEGDGFVTRFTLARPLRAGLLALAAVAAAAFLLVTPAVGAPPQAACDARTNNTYDKLLECVRLDGVRAHQAAFQAIAAANGGTRAAATPGYDASVDYVIETLEAAGWSVETDQFDFTVAQPIRQLTPIVATHATGGVTGSALGTVTAAVVPVDINLTPPRANTSGCDGAFAEAAVGAPLTAHPGGPDDFAGFPIGAIALVQRGGCSFALKVANAQTAGAAAVILFNQGNVTVPPTDRTSTLTNITAVPPAGSAFTTITIPVVGTSFAAGQALAQPGTRATVSVINVPQLNVIAELEGRNDDNVVMAGAHLDSVLAGPGINDNGSGSAVLLELAEQLAKLKPENTLRFAWWGAEEAGLIGSTAYVNGLSQAERDRIALYLNFDMVGSPNYIQMVYDADESSFEAPVPIPAGSTAIEDVFESFYTLLDEPYDDTAFSGRSDYQAFILNGIPSGGLFTGAEQIKTAEQQAIWGGTTGAQFDPCYHVACDTFANNNDHALDVNADAIAVAVLTYAYSTETVNGVPGKRVPGKFALPAPAGPEGTFIP
jgi:Zn-dependent M28 family amino/carboxypeptidase